MNLTDIAAILQAGGVGVIPTETVYGLAGNALDPGAVRRIYDLKGRPHQNPLIVHLARAEAATDVAELPKWRWLDSLLQAFWPGPLSVVLPKRQNVPDITSGGLDTVAVRVPNHPLTRELLASLSFPLAAPSANLYGELSPTSVDQLSPALRAGVGFVLDGGPCAIGIESTVVDATRERPVILRPGMISAADIAEATGIEPATELGNPKSPGHADRHYSPITPVRLVAEVPEHAMGIRLGPNESPANFAQRLYRDLYALDQQRAECIFVQTPPDTEAWAALWDRLRRAATR